MPVITASQAQSFVSSIGVNTHLGFTNTPANNLSWIKADLTYLGINNIRDPGPDTVSQFDALAAQGIKIDFTDYYFSNSMPTFISQAAQIVQDYPGAIAYIEGPNEADLGGSYSYNGLADAAAANQNQKNLYAAVRANSTLAKVPVFVWPLAFEANASSQGNMTGYANFGNLHSYYFGNFSTPILQQLQANISTERSVVLPGASVAVTETGYSTAYMDSSGYGVDYATQAKLTLDTVLDGAKVGLKMDYLYDLIDDAPDLSRDNLQAEFGLFDSSNNPKPAAVALKNLTSILSDSGSNATTFTPGQLNYSLIGMPTTANSYLFEKSNGTFDLALWAEPDIWNPSTHRMIAAPSNPVTVTLGQTFGTVAVYDPVTGSAPIATYNNVSQIQVNLSADALIVQASGSPSPPAPIPSPNGTVVLAGSASTIVDASANKWNIVGGVVQENGILAGFSANVVELAYVNGTVWQENTAKLWWQWNGTTWAGSGTSTSPLPPPVPTASPNNTMVLAGSASTIVDASANKWNIVGDVVQENGKLAGFSSGVIELAYVNGTVWQENTAKLWWQWNGTTWTGSGTSTSPLPAPITISSGTPSAIVSQSQVSVVATAGQHMVFIGGSGDVVRLTGGASTITDSGTGNTYILPAAGKGTNTFTSNILATGDTLDLHDALAATNWSGTSSNLSDYLRVTTSASAAALSIAATSGGKGTMVASINGATSLNLPDLLAHSIF